MSDPAVEAARRAEQASGWWKSGYSTPWDHDYAVDSIREALKPIREKSAELEAMFGGAATDVASGVRLVLAQIRPLLYASDELEELR